MKKLLFIVLVIVSIQAMAQAPVKNGTIYKDHPYITMVKQISDLFLKHDTTALAKFYADTVKFYDSPQPERGYTLKEAKADWKRLYEEWDIKEIKQRGYPDALEYTSDPFTVQSWWSITAVNKKTGKTAKFEEVIFDEFNKAGKISRELSYYDATAIIAATK
jgi:hypothetical protein